MGGSVNFPADREGSSTTGAVAELLNAFTFPTIVPLGTDMAVLADLPELPVLGEGGPCRLAGIRTLMDGTAAALSAVARHQNQTAALTAVLVERMVATLEAEETVLELDLWQRETGRAGLRAEIAVVLSIPEGLASALMINSVTLIRHLPTTMGQLSAGVLGWGHAVIIAQETTLLREAQLPQEVIDAFEELLLGKAEQSTLQSFREKARRARERMYPETLAPRSRRAYENRRIGISRSRDGMSWLNLYGPSPTIEAIWIQCTATAQAAQGPHENRTLTQLRADIAAALLLCQTLEQNTIHTPAPVPVGEGSAVSDEGVAEAGARGAEGATAVGSSGGPAGGGGAAAGGSGGPAGTGGQSTWFSAVDSEPDPCHGGGFPDPDTRGPYFHSWQLPIFDDPDYQDPTFKEPDPRNQPDWPVPGQPPHLTPATTTNNGSDTSGTSDPSSGNKGTAGSGTGLEGTTVPGTGGDTLPLAVTAGGGVWPPLPQVTPILLVPALSLLGFTDEPAWMSGVGPVSIEVAKYLTANAPSFYRVMVDPISNQPLDAAPDLRRLTQAMKLRLLIRDEYCQFPGCNARAVNCEEDHISKFSTGGQTMYDNLESLCRMHHRLKHHKDDRARTGAVRTNQTPERQATHPRGWTPRMTPAGVQWTTPTGYICPPEQQDTQPPVYNEALKILIDATLQALEQQRQEVWDEDHPCDTDLTAPPWEYRPDEEVDDGDFDYDEAAGWDPDNLPEPPPQSDEELEILDRLSIEDYLRHHPHAG